VRKNDRLGVCPISSPESSRNLKIRLTSRSARFRGPIGGPVPKLCAATHFIIMNKLILYTAMAALAATTANVEAKHKDKDKDHDRDWDRDRHEHRDNWRSRNIYVIERDRPVQRVVYIDDDGRYFRWIDGRREYVRGRYFESYPSRYYTPSGERRLEIRLPF